LGVEGGGIGGTGRRGEEGQARYRELADCRSEGKSWLAAGAQRSKKKGVVQRLWEGDEYAQSWEGEDAGSSEHG